MARSGRATFDSDRAVSAGVGGPAHGRARGSYGNPHLGENMVRKSKDLFVVLAERQQRGSTTNGDDASDKVREAGGRLGRWVQGAVRTMRPDKESRSNSRDSVRICLRKARLVVAINMKNLKIVTGRPVSRKLLTSTLLNMQPVVLIWKLTPFRISSSL